MSGDVFARSIGDAGNAQETAEIGQFSQTFAYSKGRKTAEENLNCVPFACPTFRLELPVADSPTVIRRCGAYATESDFAEYATFAWRGCKTRK